MSDFWMGFFTAVMIPLVCIIGGMIWVAITVPDLDDHEARIADQMKRRP